MFNSLKRLPSPQRNPSMLFNLKTLQDYTLRSLDRDIGKVKDFYFDDHDWSIRYLLLETDTWLTERQVLISPLACLSVNQAEQTMTVNLSHQQIEDSPTLGTDQPISQQFEKSYFAYYGWPSYWDSSRLDLNPENRQAYSQIPRTWDPHLHSMKKMLGYQIQTKDDSLEQIEGFIIDLDAWRIRHLIVHTQNWRPGKKVLISPLWIKSVSSQQSKVFVKYLSETIRDAPEYKDISQLTQQAQIELYQYDQRQGYYSRHGYWINKFYERQPSLN